MPFEGSKQPDTELQHPSEQCVRQHDRKFLAVRGGPCHRLDVALVSGTKPVTAPTQRTDLAAVIGIGGADRLPNRNAISGWASLPKEAIANELPIN